MFAYIKPLDVHTRKIHSHIHRGYSRSAHYYIWEKCAGVKPWIPRQTIGKINAQIIIITNTKNSFNVLFMQKHIWKIVKINWRRPVDFQLNFHVCARQPLGLLKYEYKQKHEKNKEPLTATFESKSNIRQ